MTPKSRFTLSNTIVFLPWIVIVLVAIVAYRAISGLDTEIRRQSGAASPQYVNANDLASCLAAKPPQGQPPLAPADAAASCIKSEKTVTQAIEEVAKPRLDELKWMLTIIGSLGAFFVIAQTGAAWFTAQVYTKQAEDSLKAITATQDAIKARYPLFEDVERVRNKAFSMLDKAFAESSKARDAHAGSTEALDWKDNLYRRLEVEARQELLSVESFASIDLHPGPFNETEHADILKKFSLFYKSKFHYEDGLSNGAFCDLERAESYLRLAYEKRPDFTIKNDLGLLYVFYFQAMMRKGTEDARIRAAVMLDRARELFEASLRLEPDQQRARYCLAVIDAKYNQHFDRGITLLEQSLERKNWQREPSDYMTSIIHYNIACYTARKLTEAPNLPSVAASAQASAEQPASELVPHIARILEHLDKTVQFGSIREEVVKPDFEKEGGDFYLLIQRADPAILQQIQRRKEALLEAAKDRNQAAKPETPAHAVWSFFPRRRQRT